MRTLQARLHVETPQVSSHGTSVDTRRPLRVLKKCASVMLAEKPSVRIQTELRTMWFTLVDDLRTSWLAQRIAPESF